MTAAAYRPETVATLAATHGDLHVFPTSFQQQRFWMLDQIDEKLAAYTMPIALRLTGPLHVDALGRAWQTLVDRHESLRTVFTLDGDALVQVVIPRLDVPLTVEDLSSLDMESRERAATARAQANANASFDLATGPLVRAALLRLGAEEHVLLLALHHIVADGWSLGVLFAELDRAYAAHVARTEPELPPLALQYADFAVWQRKVLGGAAAARQLDHWARRLEGVSPLELTTDRPRPNVESLAGAKREARIPADVARAVRALAQSNGATPYMTCLAAFVALLHRYTRQQDFAVGAITSGRGRAELEPLIGLFVNMLAVRVASDAEEPFDALLARVRDAVVDAMANQDVPFEQVVERVQPARDRSRSPIFQIAFQLLDGLGAAPRLSGLTVSTVPATKETAKFELTLILRSAPDGGFVTVAEYNTDLFDASTIDRMLAHYGALLAAAARDAKVAVGRLRMLGEDERATVTKRYNPPPTPVPAWSVPERVLVQAAESPDAPAVRADDETLTYGELARRSAIVARRLLAAGVRAGDRVAVCMHRTSALPVALLGVLRAGAAYVPLDPTYPADRIAHVLSDAGVRAVLADAASAQRLPRSDAPVLTLDASTWLDAASDADALASSRVDDEALAYVLYTSGSTGTPKGVMIPHRALSNFLASMAARPGLAAGDALVAVTTISFDIAGLELWLPLITGAEVVLASRDAATDGVALRALVDRTARTHADARVMLQATPATWRLLIEAGWDGTPNMVMLCGGEAWPAGLSARLRRRGGALWNVYGPTETTIWSTRALVAGDDVPLGEPLANTTLYVLEPAGEPAPLGVAGELWIGGAGLALGYHGRADLTAERFVTHAELGRLYRTGDLVRRTADGRLAYLGRLDDQVKVRGYRIELGEIESVLAAAPGVARAAAAAHRASESGDYRLVAYVVLADGTSDENALIDELYERVRRALPEYMVPVAIVRLDALPLTPNGKLDRRALPAPEADAVRGAVRPYVAPRTPLEEQIAVAWAAVLGVERVGVHDDFFALGGHSLVAMRVLARLAETAPTRVTIGMVLGAPTVAGLAELIERRVAEEQGTASADAAATRAIPKRAESGATPLSSAQEMLWVHEQMTPGTEAYHVPMVRRVKGALDVGALERALDVVVARHEALRTAFVEVDGAPRQAPVAAPAMRVAVHDLRGRPAATREREADELLRAAAAQPFDLAAGTFPHVTLVRLADDESLLMTVVHHIVFDGASVAVFFRELSAAYAAERDGRTAAFDSLAIQLADYAAWERGAESAARVEDAVGFWRVYLDGATGTVDLPTDRPRSGAVAAPAARMVRVFGPALTAAVGELGRAAQATPFMVWLAAFQSLLYRASRQDDIVVGAPIAGRSRPETQGVIGHFANTLALRARFADDPSFTELLAQVRDGCLRAYEHQEIPFERVARTLRAETARAMEFNIAFVLQERGGAELALGDLALEPHAVSGSTAKFDLTLSMSETPDGVRAALEYRSDLFDAATAEALLARYERIVRSALASPDVAVSRLALLTSGERELILGSWRGTRVDYPRDATIHDLFAEQARKSPDAVAVVHGGRALTYGELDLQANQLANRLRALGVGPDVPVAICVSRSIEMVVGVLGILKAGGAYVPLDPSYPTQRLALIVGDARPRVILTEDALVARLSACELADIADRPVVLRLDGDWSSIASESDSAPASGATAESLAYVIYTSGSTGTPKGVAAVHRGVTRLVVNPAYVRLGSSETLLSFAPLSFDASTLELWGALCTGGRLVIFPGDAPSLAELGDVIAQHGVTTLWLTAALFHQFVDEHLDGLRPVRQLLAGGDVLSVPHVRRVLDAIPGCTLINGYGPTENTTFTCCHPVPRDAELGATVPIGRPIGNTTVYIVDRWMQPVPWGIPGRLYTGGDGLARGYLGMPELTAERFLADPFDATPGARVYDTGDLARWRSDGTVEFLGRADTQLKIRGFRIEPGEVESALLGEPDVQEAVVVAREVTSGDKRLVAYVVPRAGARLDVVAIRSRLAERIPAFMVPSVVVSLDALPLTSSGKVDRRALPAPPAAGEGTAVVPPRNDVERVVARTFGEVLGHEPASVESSFFDLGGHSLLAIRVVAQVLKIFRTRLPLRRFFDDPTVAGVSRAIVAEEAKPGHAAAIAAMLIKIQSMSPAEREQLRRDRARPDQSSR